VTDAINAPVPPWLDRLYRQLAPKGPAFETALELHVHAYEQEQLIEIVSSTIANIATDAGKVPPIADWPSWLREATLAWGIGAEKDGHHIWHKIRTLGTKWHAISHGAKDVLMFSKHDKNVVDVEKS